MNEDRGMCIESGGKSRGMRNELELGYFGTFPEGRYPSHVLREGKCTVWTGGEESRWRERHGRGTEARCRVYASQKLVWTLRPWTPTNQSQQRKDIIRQCFLKTPLLAAPREEDWRGSKGKETILESNYTQSPDFKCLVHNTVSNLAQ